MEVKLIRSPTDEDWLLARNNALATQRKSSDKTPSSKLRLKMVLSEHSPIRDLVITWEWIDLPYWVSVHFTRHSVGITHFVSSQRNDIQHVYDRRSAPQSSPVNHRASANFQEILNISKARLCINASTETRMAWQQLLEMIKPVAPELYSCCVKPCVYRNGICPEVFKCCGFNKSNKFEQERDNYLKLFEGAK